MQKTEYELRISDWSSDVCSSDLIGVILLMFGVGLHFSLRDLLSVRNVAIPGALVQIAAATLMGMGLAWILDWGLAAGLVFGLALSVASTVVLLRALQGRNLVQIGRAHV